MAVGLVLQGVGGGVRRGRIGFGWEFVRHRVRERRAGFARRMGVPREEGMVLLGEWVPRARLTVFRARKVYSARERWGRAPESILRAPNFFRVKSLKASSPSVGGRLE